MLALSFVDLHLMKFSRGSQINAIEVPKELLLGVGADRVELISKMGPAAEKVPSFEEEVRAHLEELK